MNRKKVNKTKLKKLTIKLKKLMELDFELFYWLQENGIIEEEEPAYSKYKEISEPIAKKFLSGFVLSKILQAIESRESEINTGKDLNGVKDTLTGIEIIANWNILFNCLEEEFMIHLDEKMKHLIINQDKKMISQLFNIVYEIYGKSDEDFQKNLKELMKEVDARNRILEESRDRLDQSGFGSARNRDSVDGGGKKSLYLTGVDRSRSNLNVTLKFDSKQLEPINFKDLSVNTPIDQIEKVTEFILIAFAREIKRTPMEVAMLLTERSKYFYNIVVCGKDGDFKFIVRFLERIYTFTEKLVKLCLTDTSRKTLRLFLNFLKCGLVSRSEEVAKWTCNILTTIGYLLDCMNELDAAYSIFIKDIKVLKVVVLGMKRHPGLKRDMLEVITCFGKDNIKDLIQTEIRRYLPSGYGFYKFTHEFLLELMRNRITMRYIEEGNVLKEWIEEAIGDIRLQPDLSINTNIYALKLLVDIWIRFDKNIDKMAKESKQRIFENIESVVKEGKDKPQCLHLALITSICHLYSSFWESDPILARRIKIIFNEYICTYKATRHANIREHLIMNISDLIENGKLDISSFIRNLLQSYDQDQSLMNNADFSLIRTIVIKNKLNDESLLYILDYFCKVFMSNFVLMGITSMYIIMIIKKKRKKESFIQHTIKFVKVLFNWLYKQKSKFSENQLKSSSRRKKEGGMMIEKRYKVLDLLQLIIQTEPNQRVSNYIKNLTGFLNFKLNGGKSVPGKTYEIQDVLRPVMRQFYDEGEMSQVALQYQGVFSLYFDNLHPYSEAKNHGFESQEFDDMMHNDDILGEENNLNRQFMSMSSILETEEKKEIKKKRKKMRKKILRTEKKLNDINNGSMAFKRDMEHIREMKKQQREKQKEELLEEKKKKDREMKLIKHAERIVEKQRLLIGNTIKQDYPMRLEDLVSGLNTIEQIEPNHGINFIYCLKDESDEEVKKTVEIWFEKWEFFLNEIFRYCAVRFMDTRVGKKVKLTASKPELYKFVKMIQAHKIVTMPKIAYIMKNINLKYTGVFSETPLIYSSFRDFCINLGMLLWPAKIDEPVLVILDRFIEKYRWEVKMNDKYKLMRKYCKVSYKNISKRFKSEEVYDDGSRDVVVETVGYVKKHLDKELITIPGDEEEYESLEAYMMCYEIVNDLLYKHFGTSVKINKRVSSKLKIRKKPPLVMRIALDKTFGKYYTKKLVKSKEDERNNDVVDLVKDMVDRVQERLREEKEEEEARKREEALKEMEEVEERPETAKEISKFRISSEVKLNRFHRGRLEEEMKEKKRYAQSMKEFKKRGKELKEKLKGVKITRKQPITMDRYIQELDIKYKQAKRFWASRKQEDLEKMAKREEERREREREKIEMMNAKIRKQKNKIKKNEQKITGKTKKLIETLDFVAKEWKKKTKRKRINVHKNYDKTRKRYKKLHEFNESLRDGFDKKKEKLWDMIESKEFENLLKTNKKRLTHVFQAYRKLHKKPLAVPADHLTFEAFFTFCGDFGIIPKNAKPGEIRNILVVLEKFELKKPTKSYNYFDMEQFSEAIFILAFAKVMLPHPSKLALGKISNDDHKFNVGLQLEEVNVQLMTDFLDSLGLSDNYREVDRRVQKMQMEKGAKILRFLDDVVKTAKRREKIENEREEKIAQLSLKKRGRSGISRRSRNGERGKVGN